MDIKPHEGAQKAFFMSNPYGKSWVKEWFGPVAPVSVLKIGDVHTVSVYDPEHLAYKVGDIIMIGGTNHKCIRVGTSSITLGMDFASLEPKAKSAKSAKAKPGKLLLGLIQRLEIK